MSYSKIESIKAIVRKNSKDIKPKDWVWVLWLSGVIVSFAALEAHSIKTGSDTLSMATWKTAKGWPPLGVVYGMILGGLGVHLFWTDEGLEVPKRK